MELAQSGQSPNIKNSNEINLENYFLYKNDFNCLVYIHKKFTNTHGTIKEPEPKAEIRKRPRSKQSNNKDTKYERPEKPSETVLQQTIKFAKKLIPLTIPPSRDKFPVYYTIKTSKSSRKKARKESSFEQDTFDKGKSKTITKRYKKEIPKNCRESLSIRDSISQSFNTLDDTNVNQSLSCTISEVSEKKSLKDEINRNIKRNDPKKFVISESFEAVATEKLSEGAGIKIHLMNEADKKMLTDSIRIPVLNTIQDCLGEINNNEIKTDLISVEKCVMSNAYKLDVIIKKLACIEKKLKVVVKASYMPIKMTKGKTSTLERLGEDNLEGNDDTSNSEESQYPTDVESKNDVLEYLMKDKNISKLGCGEVATGKTTSSIGVKTDHPSRLPTRFCWTDTAMKNKD